MTHRDLQQSEAMIRRESSYGIAQASIVADVRQLLSDWSRSGRTENETLRLIAARVGYYLAPERPHMTTRNVRAQQTETDETDDLHARLTTTETELADAKVAIGIHYDAWKLAEARVEALEQWRVHWMQLAVSLTETLREIEAYPVGDSGFQDIARAALACPPQQRGE